jgi:hypothetical protein
LVEADVKVISLRRHGRLLGWLVLAAFALPPALAEEDKQVRWRFNAYDGRGYLTSSDTDEPTDDVGLLLLRCREKSGDIEVTGIPGAEFRGAIGATIATDKYPLIEFVLKAPGQTSLLRFEYSELHETWLYNFNLSSKEEPFETFKRTGILEFKLGEARDRRELKAGLEAIAKFQAFCQPPTK